MYNFTRIWLLVLAFIYNELCNQFILFYYYYIIALHLNNHTMPKYSQEKQLIHTSDDTEHSTYNGPCTTTYYIIAFLSKVYIITYIYWTVLFPFCMTPPKKGWQDKICTWSIYFDSYIPMIAKCRKK